MKKIALISPSSPAPDLTPETITRLKDIFSRAGYQIHLGSHSLDATRYLAGTDDDRATDVMRAFTDDSIDIVMTVRGGYGSPRLLDRLDYNILSQHKKPFYTISDGTALQTALYTRAGISGYSGIQALFWLGDNTDLIRSTLPTFDGNLLSVPLTKTDTVGRAQGIAIGGNLVVFTSLIGTPYFPDMTGKILIIEDVNESPYKVDRMLTQLRLAGVFNQIAGLVIGDFSSCIANDPADGSAEEVFSDFFASAPFPVARIHYGHRNRKTIVPIGKPVILDTTTKTLKEIS